MVELLREQRRLQHSLEKQVLAGGQTAGAVCADAAPARGIGEILGLTIMLETGALFGVFQRGRLRLVLPLARSLLRVRLQEKGRTKIARTATST